MKYICIKDLQDLNEHLSKSEDPQDFFIVLNGFARSSKSIMKDGDEYSIINEIDGSEQLLSAEKLFDTEYSFIGEAITNGCFFKYGE